MVLKKIVLYSLSFLLAATFVSCEKEYSLENSGAPNELIVGINCRISKISYTDTATNTGLGALFASINSLDNVTQITKFDSVSNTIEYRSDPVITNDTIYINANEYFTVDINKRILKLHGLIDPTDPLSPQFDVVYLYSASGYLIQKNYAFTGAPTIPYQRVDYAYVGGNLTGMAVIDLTNGDTSHNATVTYYNNIVPKRYIYIFPDEKYYPNFTQFYDFGLRPYNAVRGITVRNYDPGNVLRDSTVSSFSNYIMSRDTYVLSVIMNGDAEQSVPAPKSKLSFSYKCK